MSWITALGVASTQSVIPIIPISDLCRLEIFSLLDKSNQPQTAWVDFEDFKMQDKEYSMKLLAGLNWKTQVFVLQDWMNQLAWLEDIDELSELRVKLFAITFHWVEVQRLKINSDFCPENWICSDCEYGINSLLTLASIIETVWQKFNRWDYNWWKRMLREINPKDFRRELYQ